MAAERGISDKTEATRFSQCAHDQRRRLEAEDCDSIRCAQLISGGRRRIYPPYCLAHARPTMCCIRLVITFTPHDQSNVYVRVLCIGPARPELPPHLKEGRNEAVSRPNQRSTPRRNPRSQPGARRREERGRPSEPGLFIIIIMIMLS